MDFVAPDSFRCAVCASVLIPSDWGFNESTGDWASTLVGPVCALCDKTFCRKHLIQVKGGAICASCRSRYEELLVKGPVGNADEERMVHLLDHDVRRTVDGDHGEVIADYAARIRLVTTSLAEYESKVVDDVQQYLHDTFADTTWPRCPHHPNHPLWYSDGWWRIVLSG